MSFKFATSGILFLILNTKAEICKTPDNKSGECLLLRECPNVLVLTANKTDDAVDFVRKSICGFSGVDPKVCCPTPSESCKTPDDKSGECVLLRKCPSVLQLTANKTKDAEDFVRKSICGFSGADPLVCCPTQNSNNSSNTPKNKTSNIHLLPDRRFCGYQHSDDYFHQTNSAEITEFPWLARIAYLRTSESEDSYKKEYRCVGSLINTRYILTTAACVTIPDAIITDVRLGEYHINNDTDCVSDAVTEECSDVEDYQLAKIIAHPEYNRNLKINDIGLLRLKEAVKYSDYIRPICLPFPGTTYANVGDTLTTSGWGFRSGRGDRAMIKKKVLGQIIPNDECLQRLKSSNKNLTLTEGQLCTISPENSTDFSCDGDSGAPVIFSHRLQWHQEGILSFGRGRCGATASNVYTKVRYYLDWILETIEP